MDGSVETGDAKRPRVRICIHRKCALRGSMGIAGALCSDLRAKAIISETDECFRFCKDGPNVAVDGVVLHGISESNANLRIQSELRHPSVKRDVVGMRSIDDLDAVLDDVLQV